MSELAKGWAVAGWILRLFINLMKNLTGQTSVHDGNFSHRREANSSSDIEPSQQSGQTSRDSSTFTAANQYQYIVGNNSSMCDTRRDEFGLTQTNQLMSDIIWAPDQNDFDFDILLNSAQSNSLFPFSLG